MMKKTTKKMNYKDAKCTISITSEVIEYGNVTSSIPNGFKVFDDFDFEDVDYNHISDCILGKVLNSANILI